MEVPSFSNFTPMSSTTAKHIRHFSGASVVCHEAYANERQVDGILSLRGKMHVRPVSEEY